MVVLEGVLLLSPVGPVLVVEFFKLPLFAED